MSYTKLVTAPPRSAINGGMTPCPTGFLQREYGEPNTDRWNDMMVSRSLGLPYRLETVIPASRYRPEGHPLLFDRLRAGLDTLRKAAPVLYDALGLAGVRVVRTVRGNPKVWSNHAFGLAVDFTIDGRLDPYGDGTVQRGLLDLYSHLKRQGLYWGAEFGREDGMHFEVSAEAVMNAVRRGTFA